MQLLRCALRGSGGFPTNVFEVEGFECKRHIWSNQGPDHATTWLDEYLQVLSKLWFMSQTKHTVKSKDSKKEVQALNVREAALSTCHEALFDSKKQKHESHRKRRESFKLNSHAAETQCASPWDKYQSNGVESKDKLCFHVQLVLCHKAGLYGAEKLHDDRFFTFQLKLPPSSKISHFFPFTSGYSLVLLNASHYQKLLLSWVWDVYVLD